MDLMDMIKYVIWKWEYYTFISIWKDNQIRKIFNKHAQKERGFDNFRTHSRPNLTEICGIFADEVSVWA